MSKKIDSTKTPLPWRYQRYYTFIIVTIISLGMPWIVIDGNHFFLLSFDKMSLHLIFVAFDIQELYLMPFLLILLFLGIFGITVVGGRIFCGWACPQTIFRVVYRDLIETKILGLRKKIKNKQVEPDMSLLKNKIKKLLAILIWSILSLIAAADFFWYFVPPEDFFTYLFDFENHWTLFGSVLGVAAFLIYDVIFLKENFCVYVCPYARIQSVLYDDHTIMALYNTHRGGNIYDNNKKKQFTKQKELREFTPASECTTCENCVTVCPTHIDIRKGLQIECINCLECVDACTIVMGKLKKPSLITWSSDFEIIDQKGKTQYFRTKVLAYMVLLVGLIAILATLGSNKEHMLLNINKETRAYSTKLLPDGKVRVDNAYEFLLQNTQNEKMKFYFEVITPSEMNGKITIAKPKRAFTVVPWVKKKKIVVLRTTDILVENDRKDTIIPIKIRAYALENEEKIVIFREATFVFPRLDILKTTK